MPPPCFFTYWRAGGDNHYLKNLKKTHFSRLTPRNSCTHDALSFSSSHQQLNSQDLRMLSIIKDKRYVKEDKGRTYMEIKVVIMGGQGGGVREELMTYQKHHEGHRQKEDGVPVLHNPLLQVGQGLITQ